MAYELFPPIEPFATGTLAVDPPHRLYFEQVGRRDGAPVVFLHGGPGSGCGSDPRRFFDPERFRVVLFDQRGAGRSTPIAETAGNTTQHLVADIEALRRHLGIERWIVFGGSWGSTLALAYAEAHPERVAALVLRGIWLCRPEDLDWWLYGMRTVFPEAWAPFAAHIPEAERGDLLSAYHRRLNHPDPDVHLAAAQVWKTYESSCARLIPDPAAAKDRSPRTLAMSRIEAHYMINRVFLEDGQLLRDLARIRHIPAWIVHGRYDIVCPMSGADALIRAWPEARVHISPAAGHSAMDSENRRALVKAMAEIAAGL